LAGAEFFGTPPPSRQNRIVLTWPDYAVVLILLARVISAAARR